MFFVGQFLVLHYKKKKLPQEVPSMSFTCINFFLPKYCILFSLSSWCCKSLRKSLSFQNFSLIEGAKIIQKKLRLKKKNDLVNYSFVFSTKMVVKCKGFVIQRNFFFFFSTLALFEQLDWKENGVACQFPLLNVPLFFTKVALSVEKKKD